MCVCVCEEANRSVVVLMAACSFICKTDGNLFLIFSYLQSAVLLTLTQSLNQPLKYSTVSSFNKGTKDDVHLFVHKLYKTFLKHF